MSRIPQLRNSLLLACMVLFTSASGMALPASLAHPILRDIVTGHAQDALNALATAITEHPDDALALELRCRVQIQENHWNRAIASCQQAVRLKPSDSNAHLWLGRAYGGRASTANRLTALGLAVKLRNEFETAIQLDPRNIAAYAALGEFDVQAPSLLGGGLDRARALTAKLQTIAPANAHALLAKIAESQRDYALSESEWKNAVKASPQPAQAWMELASFYRRRGRYDEMIKAAENGAASDRDHSASLVYGAQILIRAQRNLPEAEQWLREYLASSAQSEDTPAFAVHAQLARLLQREGKTAEAQQEIAAARALAPDYSPHA
ncbi:MAG: tetratricopeptide repeat protein [Acidobacteriaceae bacterium]